MTKTTVVSLLAISLLATTGIGFAAFTTSSTNTYQFSAGKTGYSWSSVTFYATNSSGTWGNSIGAAVDGGVGGTPLTLSVSNLAPGDTFILYATLTNTGSVAESIVEAGPVTVNDPSSCGAFFYQDTLSAPSTSTFAIGGHTYTFPNTNALSGVLLAPGHSVTIYFAMGLLSTAGNACQGTSAYAIDSITATAPPLPGSGPAVTMSVS